MLYVLVTALFIASGGHAQFIEEGCDAKSQLQVCIEKTPKTPQGLPKTRKQLEAHCLAYNTGMGCMDAWIRRCLPTDGQKFLQKQIGGARRLMKFLCSNDSALRRDYLKELTCWSIVSPDWSRCVHELQSAVREITDRAQTLVYFAKNSELCCARDDYLACVSRVSEACSASAGTLMRRMAWVLAQDVAACSLQSAPTCSTSGVTHHSILTVLSSVLLYWPNFAF